MAGFSLGRKTLWQYTHSISILFAVLLFLAGFLCVLLWTNGIVTTPTSAGDALTATFTYNSPTVSTFSLTYQVAIFGIAWNSIMFVTLLVLERDALPMSTERLRYEVEKAAIIVSVVGNAVYSVACLALMATLARLAADASSTPMDDSEAAAKVAASAEDRRAGQGATAAMAGFAAATAILTCFMDVIHAQNSRHRSIIKNEPLRDVDGVKQA